MKHVKEKYGKVDSFVIRAVEVKNDVYEIDLDTFLKFAKIVEPKTETAPNGENAAK
jgi:hypothetical protein